MSFEGLSVQQMKKEKSHSRLTEANDKRYRSLSVCEYDKKWDVCITEWVLSPKNLDGPPIQGLECLRKEFRLYYTVNEEPLKFSEPG